MTLLASLVSCAYPVTPPARVNELYREVLEQRHFHYRLKAGDTVVMDLYNRGGDLNQRDIVVLPDGKSDLFFMHDVQLEGKTVSEIETEAKSRLAKEVRDVDSLEVRIQVKPALEKVHVVGQFRKPGSFDLSIRQTVSETISMVDGMRVTGDTDYALLRRPFQNPRKPAEFRIDLNDNSEAIYLLPGDQIILERGWVATVLDYWQEYVLAFLGVNPFTYTQEWTRYLFSGL